MRPAKERGCQANRTACLPLTCVMPRISHCFPTRPAILVRTFKYTILAPSSSWYLMRTAGVAKGASAPGKEFVGTVSVKGIYEIARSKQQVRARAAAIVGAGGRGAGGAWRRRSAAEACDEGAAACVHARRLGFVLELATPCPFPRCRHRHAQCTRRPPPPDPLIVHSSTPCRSSSR